EVVRVVGEKVVVTAPTDDLGQFRVTGLAAGPYRVEVERGTVRPPLPPPRPPIVITRNELRCCVCAMERARSFGTVLGRAAQDPAKLQPIDTRSTTQGVVIRDPGR
ncbi:MAG TPA: hypothetical protein VFV99_19670, partial [Kofleriaceae bacterium]|nr:hypothetical protein [Kofleriaceae bacterium]